MRLPSGKEVNNNTPIYSGSNFTWGEVTNNGNRQIQDLVIDGRLIISAIAIENKIIDTATKMDKYRAKLGGYPIRPTSWYRPSYINKYVGGSKWSRHQFGDAVDWISFRLTPKQIEDMLESQHNDGGYHCYVSKNFTHTDWRGTRARW